MHRLTERAHELCKGVIAPGEAAIDATAGNGYDTLFLARQVGPDGVVYAFDQQADAIRETATRLQREGFTNATLLQSDHAELRDSIRPEHHGRIAVVMFNLGYLPGGDKTVITRPATTVPAIEQSLELLRPGGILTVLCYTGHAGGGEETAAVRSLLSALPAELYDLEEFHAVDRIAAPVLFAAAKR